MSASISTNFHENIVPFLIPFKERLSKLCGGDITNVSDDVFQQTFFNVMIDVVNKLAEAKPVVDIYKTPRSRTKVSPPPPSQPAPVSQPTDASVSVDLPAPQAPKQDAPPTSTQVPRPKKVSSAAEVEKPLCAYMDKNNHQCDHRVGKVDRLLDGKVYCHRHYPLMEKRMARPNVNHNIAQPVTIPIVKTVAKKKAPEPAPEPPKFTIFDFENELYVRFDTNKQWWALEEFVHETFEGFIHEKTKLVFEKENDQYICVGWFAPNSQIWGMDMLEPEMITWCTLSHLKFRESHKRKSADKAPESHE